MLKVLFPEIVFMSLLIMGCSGTTGLSIGKVSGVVTMDGQSLPQATVMFQPALGRPSMGVTDDSGRYQLSYAPGIEGATLGEHQVIIRTEIAGADGEPVQRKEMLPPRYNNNSELKTTVLAGQNTCNFALSSK